MRIPVLFLDQQAWRAGGQRVLEDVLDALREEIEPIVALPEDGPFAAALRGRNINTMTYPLGSYRPGRKSMGEVLAFPIRSLVSGLKLAQVVRQRGIRLIYINGPRCLPAGVLAARLTGTPSIYHLHRTLTRRSDRLITAWAAAHVTRIVSVSQAAADSLVRANPRLAGKTQIVYNPLRPPGRITDLSTINDSPSALPVGGGPVVGMVGRITPQKGQLVLLRATALLRERWPNLQAVFVGAPESGSARDIAYFGELHSEVARLGLGGNVHWAGFQENLDPYYARFDAVAIPSIEAEGFPLVALEAMARGVPAVASRDGGIEEIIGNGVGGLLVPPGDENALAAALGRVLGDAVLRSRLISVTHADLDQRFSPERFRTAIRRVVSELASTSREAPREKEIEARA